MVESLVGPAIFCLFLITGVIVGLIYHRIKKRALNPPPTIEQIIAKQEAELREINNHINGG